MYYKRLQKYGKKLVAAILTSALILASGATVYAEDTGEYLGNGKCNRYIGAGRSGG